MVKIVALFKRNKKLTRAEFVEYYENVHVKLFEDRIPGKGITRIVRRYFSPVSAPFTGATTESGFDGLLEIWFKDEASYQNWFNGPRDPEFDKIIREDEAKLFDLENAFFHRVEEHETDLDLTSAQT